MSGKQGEGEKAEGQRRLTMLWSCENSWAIFVDDLAGFGV